MEAEDSNSECPSRATMAEVRPKRRCVRSHEGLDRGRSPQGVLSRRSARRSHRRAPRACFLPAEPREGLRALERWAKRLPERRWAVENAGGLGRHLAGRLAASGESVVDVAPKLSARGLVASSFAANARN